MATMVRQSPYGTAAPAAVGSSACGAQPGAVGAAERCEAVPASAAGGRRGECRMGTGRGVPGPSASVRSSLSALRAGEAVQSLPALGSLRAPHRAPRGEVRAAERRCADALPLQLHPQVCAVGRPFRPSVVAQRGAGGGGGRGRDAERCPAVPAEWCGPCAGRGAPEAWSRRSWRSASPRAASCWNRSPSAERSAGAGECGGNGAGPGPAVLGSPQRSLFCSSSGCVTEARAVLIRARHLRTTLRRRGAERREWDAQESGGDALYERCRRVALEQGMGAPQHPAPR